MNSRQKRKLAAVIHNKEREAQKALELDRKENPEKYKRKRPSKKVLATAAIWSGIALSATAFDDRHTK